MIRIEITDPTREEALRLADYLYELAGYGAAVEPTPAETADVMQAHIVALAEDDAPAYVAGDVVTTRNAQRDGQSGAGRTCQRRSG